MKIRVNISNISKTLSGKPSLNFYCEDCHLSYVASHLDAYFWQALLDKSKLQASLDEFVKALNGRNVEFLFPKKKTAKKLLNILCYCDPKVTDFEYHKSVHRAKSILDTALYLLKKKN